MRMIRNRNEVKIPEGVVRTPQRELILETIRRNGGMLDAREIYRLVNRQDQSISLATVYRSLSLFKKAGLIDERRMGRSCGCYELKKSPEHQYMLCRRCEKVFEFESPAIADLIEQVRREKGFEIDKVEICIQGICRDCRGETTPPAGPTIK